MKERKKNIKALSIVRPSGSRIASGEKTLEVRRWRPNLAPCEDLLIVENDHFLHNAGDQDNNGVPVAIVKIRVVRPFVFSDMQSASPHFLRMVGSHGSWLMFAQCNQPSMFSQRAAYTKSIFMTYNQASLYFLRHNFQRLGFSSRTCLGGAIERRSAMSRHLSRSSLTSARASRSI